MGYSFSTTCWYILSISISLYSSSDFASPWWGSRIGYRLPDAQVIMSLALGWRNLLHWQPAQGRATSTSWSSTKTHNRWPGYGSQAYDQFAESVWHRNWGTPFSLYWHECLEHASNVRITFGLFDITQSMSSVRQLVDQWGWPHGLAMALYWLPLRWPSEGTCTEDFLPRFNMFQSRVAMPDNTSHMMASV